MIHVCSWATVNGEADRSWMIVTTHLPIYHNSSSMDDLNNLICTWKGRMRKVIYKFTSLWSWSKIGVFAIGEKPIAGNPSSLKLRASVEAGKISGFPSFPPASFTAPSNNAHHGLELSTAVRTGSPDLPSTDCFCLNCPSYYHGQIIQQKRKQQMYTIFFPKISDHLRKNKYRNNKEENHYSYHTKKIFTMNTLSYQ